MWPIMRRPMRSPGQHAVLVEMAAVKSGSVTMARRATSLKAMFCADGLGAVAMAMPWPSGQAAAQSVQLSAHPPRLPPPAASRRMPSSGPSAGLGVDPVLDRDHREVGPQARPVGGWRASGPVGRSTAGLLTPMTKKRFVSSGFAGADEVVPPALARLAGVRAGDMVRRVQRVGRRGPRCCARRPERAVGLVGQRVVGERHAAAQRAAPRTAIPVRTT